MTTAATTTRRATAASCYLYLPPGKHAPKSLPCVLIAPAGSTCWRAWTLGDGDSPEHMPYVKAGYAVLAYELDGPSTTTAIWRR